MFDSLEYTNSQELCLGMVEEADTCLLAFSTGKDSIATWLQVRKYFTRVIPYYKYVIPGLSFVEDSLKYYEDFFGTHIYRIPHPNLYRIRQDMIYQPPYRVREIAENLAIDINSYTDDIIGLMFRYNMGLPENVYTAVGVRAADSPFRRIAVVTHGAINHNKKSFWPVYDWRKADVLQAIDEAGVKLPVDYKLFGRTFDGLDYRFIKPIREHYPEDYERIRQYFPLIDLEIARWDGFEEFKDRRLEDID